MGKVTVDLPWDEIRGMVIDADTNILTITLEGKDYPKGAVCALNKETIMNLLGVPA